MLCCSQACKLLLFVLSITVRYCSGTTCLVCSSFVSNEDCNTKGILRSCRPFEVCENRVTNWNSRVLITKRCIPRGACRDNCRSGRSSVCRTCCRSDSCNKKLLSPLPRGKFQERRLVAQSSGRSSASCGPLHSTSVSTRCSRLKSRNVAGTTCVFWCSRFDYVLKGPARLTCVLTKNGPKWSGTPPSCVDKKMAQRHGNPGSCTPMEYDKNTTLIACTNDFNFRSACSFRCKDSFYMVEQDSMTVIRLNKRRSVCWRGVKEPVVWTRPPPRCMKKKCPILVIEGLSTAKCTNWIRVDSVCDFSCLPGYEKIGPRFLTCLDVNPKRSAAAWNDTIPICEPRECPALNRKLETTSVVCSNGDYFRSECTFVCAIGYYMTPSENENPLPANEEVSKCRVTRSDDMIWKPDPPSCRIKTCQDISVIENGNADCTNENRFSSTCSFSCGDAFLLSGTEKVTCIEGPSGNSPFGMWDAPIPWCRPKVCDPFVYNEDTTDVSCSNDFIYLSTCRYVCKFGYYMTASDGETFIPEGFSETECVISPERTLVWSVPAPVCLLKSCDELSDPANGYVSCSDENNHESECYFSCSDGYELQGERTLTCQDSGSHIPKQKWDFEPPWCKAKPCQRLVYDRPTTDVSCSHGLSFKSMCTFTCKEGYYMPSPTSDEVLGSSATICTLNDKKVLIWSTPSPQCLIKTCNTLSPPVNGNVRCDDDTNYNSRCVFSCDPGYEPDRDATLRCIDNGFTSEEGVWNKEVPLCIRRLCSPFDIDLGSTGYTCNEDLKFMSECEFFCFEGHYLTSGEKIVDSAFTTCGVERNVMTWTQSPPECKLKACPVITRPRRGLIRCNNANNFGSACMFLCSPGSYLDGQSMLQCQDNGINDPLGEWSHPTPTCERKPCPERKLDETPILLEECTNGHLFESSCSYSCGSGHYLTHGDRITPVNRVVVKCGVTGMDMTWSSELPICTIKNCPAANRVPENGKTSCTEGNIFDSSCLFTCNSGYYLEGNETAVCEDSEHNDPVGLWSNNPPLCLPRSCDVIAYDTVSLTMDCSDGEKFLSVCGFRCQTGYYAVDEIGEFLSLANATCMVDSEDDMVWTKPPPECVKKTCKPHLSFANGEITCTDELMYQSECVFECHPGFSLVGDAVSTCIDVDHRSKFGEWDTEIPVCERRPCPDLIYDKDTVTLNCTSFDVFESICEFSCIDGYYMTSPLDSDDIVDEASSQCQVRGQSMYWTDKSPNCLKKRCSAARRPEGGEVVCDDGNFFSSSCSFSCSIVRELKGEENLQCLADDRNIPQGYWNAPFPACELRSCPDLGIDRRAIGETCSNVYKYGSQCTFTCNEGFYTPQQHKTNDLGYTEAECDIEGSVMTWTGKPPVCEIKTCLPLIVPGNGTYGCTEGLKYGTQCVFDCTRGYLLIGQKTLQCIDDGTDGPMGVWNGVEPACEPRSCTELKYDSETQLVNCNFGVQYGSVCTFGCKEGYYMTATNGLDLIDYASAVCDVHPTNKREVEWAHDEPQCLIKICPDLEPPIDGKVDCESGTEHGSSCTYSCLPGFKTIGLLTTTCKDDGQNIPTGVWSKEPPVCEPKSCARLVSNGNTTNFQCTDRWKYRSVCTFTCNKGYLITEGDGRTIVEGGKKSTRCGLGKGVGMAWSHELPLCLSKFCLAIRPKRNMTIECTDQFKYNSRCTFACDPPLKLIGPPVLNCIDDEKSTYSGKWDNRHWGLRCRK